MSSVQEELRIALEKLAKWRIVFASWQLGTRPSNDEECRAVKDHREATIMLRTEMHAITALLVKKGVFTADEFEEELLKEAKAVDEDYERLFPGITTSPIGVNYDIPVARETMKNWPK